MFFLSYVFNILIIYMLFCKYSEYSFLLHKKSLVFLQKRNIKLFHS